MFATFNDNTGVDGAPGWSVRASPAYVAMCGTLIAQYTITGYDASAHMSEETKDAARSAPFGVLISLVLSAFFGFFVILSFLFSIQDFQNTINSQYSQPVLQIFVDVFGEDGAIVLFTLLVLCVWHCGLFSLTSNSRMMYGFARDSGLPKWFAHTDARFSSPVRTIWLAAFLAFCLGLPSLGSSVAFSAAISIATIGLYISYGLPIFLGLINPEQFNKQKGPFNLKKLSRPVALIATLWICFITIIFCLPTTNPVTSQTLNYTAVAVGIVGFGALSSWLVWARTWFVGPVREIEAERLGIDINDEDALKDAEKAGKIPHATKEE